MENTLFADLSLNWERRCAVIAAAGFDGIYAVPYPLTDAELIRLATLDAVPTRHGLKLTGVYANLDLAQPADSIEANRVMALFERTVGAPRIELSLKCSDPRALPMDLDAALASRLEPLLAIAARRGFDLALYPHSFYPLDTPAHAAKLVALSGHPRLRYVFATSHVYAVSTADETLAQLRDCASQIASFNICGCRRTAGIPSKCMHLPLDEGDLDLAPLFAALIQGGYVGEIIVQGHGWRGHLPAMLKRCMSAFSKILLPPAVANINRSL